MQVPSTIISSRHWSYSHRRNCLSNVVVLVIFANDISSLSPFFMLEISCCSEKPNIRAVSTHKADWYNRSKCTSWRKFLASAFATWTTINDVIYIYNFAASYLLLYLFLGVILSSLAKGIQFFGLILYILGVDPLGTYIFGHHWSKTYFIVHIENDIKIFYNVGYNVLYYNPS